MLTLTRQTRLYLPIEAADLNRPRADDNRWWAWGRPRPWASYAQMETTVAGVADPVGGYLLDIRDMDQWLVAACAEVHASGVVPMATGVETGVDPWLGADQFLQAVAEVLERRYAEVARQRPSRSIYLHQLLWRLAPPATLLWQRPERSQHPSHTSTPACVPAEGHPALDPMTKELDPVTSAELLPPASQANRQPPSLQLTLQYEFAAAHRLHCQQWSEEQNRDVFGKCNRASGHGHNYRLEVTVACPISSHVGSCESAAEGTEQIDRVTLINRIVNQQVLERLDHRFLNLDVAEFQQLNPTVENIAQVVYAWLCQSLPATLPLQSVRVYETDKTWATVQRVDRG
jgi:6-pyruvoyl-tetrahydropterin synthase